MNKKSIKSKIPKTIQSMSTLLLQTFTPAQKKTLQLLMHQVLLKYNCLEAWQVCFGQSLFTFTSSRVPIIVQKRSAQNMAFFILSKTHGGSKTLYAKKEIFDMIATSDDVKWFCLVAAALPKDDIDRFLKSSGVSLPFEKLPHPHANEID